MDLTGWPDVAELARALASAANDPRLAGWDPSAPTSFARAPGRLDVMGGIADYSGSLVLELPIREATSVALQRQPARTLDLVSLSASGQDRRFRAGLGDLEELDYDSAREWFRSEPSSAWAAYVAGALVVAMRERGAVFAEGARIVVRSDVPEGKGVASSAALSVASLMALDGAYGLGFEPVEVAFLAQRVENAVVGAPCGIMDPMTAVFGEKGRLLALLCQPAEIQESLEVPEELAFWGIDSGTTHAVSGAAYTRVRVGAFMGHRILEHLSGRSFGGYLANVPPSELEQHYRRELPESMTGAEFLERYGSTRDPVTTVEPSTKYRVREPTAHPVYEHFRLQAFTRLLREGAVDDAPLLGELMYQSHASYSACGLGSEATDRIVELARAAGPERGIFGAKITGGGSGGTVAVLARRDAGESVGALARQLGRETGSTPFVFYGSSPGARIFGHRVSKR